MRFAYLVAVTVGGMLPVRQDAVATRRAAGPGALMVLVSCCRALTIGALGRRAKLS